MTRAEKTAQAQALRDEGLLLREIGERMGYSLKMVQEWLSDPNREKVAARRARYSRPCADCGKPTDGSGGYADQRTRCRSCCKSYQHETRAWKREAIIEWIRAYQREFGHVPPSTVQNRKKHVPSGFLVAPGTDAVRREFGADGWRKAVRAAGFEPYRDAPGAGHKLGPDHPTIRERAELRAAGVSLTEIARRQGVTPAAVRLTLLRWGA